MPRVSRRNVRRMGRRMRGGADLGATTSDIYQEACVRAAHPDGSDEVNAWTKDGGRVPVGVQAFCIGHKRTVGATNGEPADFDKLEISKIPGMGAADGKWKDAVALIGANRGAGFEDQPESGCTYAINDGMAKGKCKYEKSPWLVAWEAAEQAKLEKAARNAEAAAGNNNNAKAKAQAALASAAADAEAAAVAAAAAANQGGGARRRRRRRRSALASGARGARVTRRRRRRSGRGAKVTRRRRRRRSSRR